jgi:hypothetical protein
MVVMASKSNVTSSTDFSVESLILTILCFRSYFVSVSLHICKESSEETYSLRRVTLVLRAATASPVPSFSFAPPPSL